MTRRELNDQEYTLVTDAITRVLQTLPWYPDHVDMSRLRFVIETDNYAPANMIIRRSDVDVIILYEATANGDSLALDLVIIQELHNVNINFPTPQDIAIRPELTREQNATGYAVAIESLEIGGSINGLLHTLLTTGNIPNTPFNRSVMLYRAGHHEPYYELLNVHRPTNVYHQRYLDAYPLI
jgi:hypothetical protein